MRLNSLLLALLVSATAFALPAQAHELRFIGDNYAIQVGDDIEPPVHGQPNGVDFFAFYLPIPGDISSAIPIDRTQAGDEIDIHVTPLILKKETFNSPIQKVLPIITTFQDTLVDGFPGIVGAITWPTAGPIGFIVTGEIKKAGHPEKDFHEKFVSGAGSQDTIFGTSFESVQ